MNKFSIAIDVKKIQKDRLRKNEFQTKNGEQVSQLLCDVIGVPTQKKFIKEGSGWKMWNVGFLVEKGTKDENTNILGSIIEFENDEDGPEKQQAPSTESQDEDDIDCSEIPF